MQVAPELWQLLCLCAALTRQTDGAFDVSAGALTGHAAYSIIQGARSRPASRLCPVCRRMGRTCPRACLDLGGIGKGYAVDRLIELFQDAGVSRALSTLVRAACTRSVRLRRTGWPILVRGLVQEEVLGVLWWRMARSPPHTAWETPGHRCQPYPGPPYRFASPTPLPEHHSRPQCHPCRSPEHGCPRERCRVDRFCWRAFLKYEGLYVRS